MIRLLFLSNMKKVSGGEVFLERVLHELDSQQFSFSILLPEGFFADRLRESGYRVDITEHAGRLNRDSGTANYPKYAAKLFLWLRATSRLAKKNSVDLIVANSFGLALHGFLLSWLTGRKFVWFHLHPILEKGTQGAMMAKLLSQRVSAIACCSHAVKDSLLACGVDPEKLFVSYTGVNTSEYMGQPALLEYHAGEDRGITLADLYRRLNRKIHLSLISVIIPWKGHKYLIEAVNLLSPALKAFLQVDIVGGLINETPALLAYKKELEDSIVRYGLQNTVFLKGFIKDLPTYYREIDVVLNCSQEPEPMGNTIVEAMANSKIAMVTNQGGPLELVDDRVTGFIVVHDQPASLAAAITALCQEMTVGQIFDMQVKAREKAVEQFDIRTATQIIEERLKLLAEGNQRRN